MRLIDADVLKEKKVRCNERAEWVVPVAEIDWMPTIDPERKTGKWIKKHGIINCSNCKQCGWSESFEATVHRFKYCPHCGSYMGDDEE